MAALEPKQDDRGRYYRNLGYVTTKSRQQPKLFLGRDRVEATARLCRLVQFWEWMKKVGEADGTEPSWGRMLPVARAIGNGDEVYRWPRDAEMSESGYAATVSLLALMIPPVIKIEPENLRDAEIGKSELDQWARRQQAIIDDATEKRNLFDLLAVQKPVGGGVHGALDAYAEYLRKEYFDSSSCTISDHGMTLLRLTTTLKRLLPDLPLADADLDAVDSLVAILRNRPIKEDGNTYAKKTCQHLLTVLRSFLRWLDRSKDFEWDLPAKYHQLSFKVKRIEADENRRTHVPTYSLSELTILYRYATAFERGLVLLALNCGHGADQSGRLKLRNLRLNEDGPSFIRSRRFKRDVEGRWRLWGHTATILKQAVSKRPKDAKFPHVLLNRRGNTLYGKSKKGDRSRQIANAWYRLLDRVQADYPEFPRHGFNSLRDTSINFVRRLGGEELASVHSAHTHQSADKQLRCYSNPTYRRLFRIHKRLEQKLSRIWAAVPDPTVDPPRPPVTLKQIDEMLKLNQEGIAPKEIADRLDLSDVTVYRHLKLAGVR